MMSFNILLCAVVLVLAVSVEAFPSSDGNRNYNYDLSGQALTDLYNTPVYKAERVVRPLEFLPFAIGDLSHSGVRVTLPDDSQWLVHKGAGYGRSSQTVVTDADNMSSRWKVKETTDFGGTKTVGDLVEAGGSTYSLGKDNCHDASRRMMDLNN